MQAEIFHSEWSHHRISSTDSKVRVTLQNSIKLSDSEQSNNAFGEVSDSIVNNTDLVTKLVDHVIELIQEKVLTLGVIDARTDSPCRVRYFSLEKRIFCFVLNFQILFSDLLSDNETAKEM